MKLKNYQEDLVLNTIHLALEDRSDIPSDDAFVHDVAAYTLNRLPPKYINSDRGFTRMAPAYWLEGSDDVAFANLVELVLLVNRAIDTVHGRRKISEETAKDRVYNGELFEEGEIGYWHNYPHLIGKVVDENTEEVVSGASITLYIDGQLSEPAEPGWHNPYFTSNKNQGFYSFWPQPSKMKADARDSIFEITFEHPNYTSFRHHQKVKTKGEFEQNDSIKPDGILNLGTISLSKQ